MTEPLPSITGRQLCKLLEKDGWEFMRNGRHGRIYKKTEGGRTRITQVTNDAGQLPKGTLKAILGPQQTNLGVEGLRRLMSRK